MKDKYLIYKLKNSYIDAKLPDRLGGHVLSGFVNNIERDPLRNRLILTVNGQSYVLKEPKSIKKDSGNIIFVYGDLEQKDEIDDNDLFEQIRNGSYVDEIIKNTATDDVFFIYFNLNSEKKAGVINNTKKGKRKYVKTAKK